MEYGDQFLRDMSRNIKALQRKKMSKIRNNYNAAKSDRFTADWHVNNLTSDEILRTALPLIRQRSRDLAINNDYAKNFFRKLKVNVIGPTGIRLNSKVLKRSDGKLDKPVNRIIEAAWRKFSKKRNCSVCGTQSLNDILNLGLESTARDGETLIRKVKGYKNDFRFALQVLEADHLDERLNQNLANGNRIRLGIEKNEWGKPINRYLFKDHPGDRSPVGQRYVTIPADEMIHPFVQERPSQSRGVPWIHTAVIKLRMLGAFEEAAVINARIGASKMGIWVPNERYNGDDDDDLDNQDKIDEVEPGIISEAPDGYDFQKFDPKYPDGDYGPFNKAILRGVSAGWGVSYNSLANDLEGVNFSSMRSGALEERDHWKVVQAWWIESVLDEIFPEWLEMAIMSGEVPLNYSDFKRLNAPRWQPRSWDWVDPLKDGKANDLELSNKTTSPQRVCAKRGEDYEDILDEIKEAREMREDRGIKEEKKVAPQGNEIDTDDIVENVLEELEERNLIISNNGRQ